MAKQSPIDATSASHAKYHKNESTFESDWPRMRPKFVNTLLHAQRLAFGLDSPRPQFSSDACLLCYFFSCFLSGQSDAPLTLAGSAGHEWWMIREEWNSPDESRKLQMQPSQLGLSNGVTEVGNYKID